MASSKEKPPHGERWLLTRKTWRYMADAGRRLIPEGWSPEHGAAGFHQLEQNFQAVCKKEKSFLPWPRKKHGEEGAVGGAEGAERAVDALDVVDACSSVSETPTTLGADSLTGSEDEVTVIEEPGLATAPMFTQASPYGASAEAYQRPTGLRTFSAGSRITPVGFDAEAAEELKLRLRQRQKQEREQRECEREREVTLGEEEETLLEDGEKRVVRCVGTQTEARPDEPLPPLPPLETDSGKGTEAEVSTPETPLSPLSVVDSRSEPYKSTTSVTSGFASVGVFGDLSSHPVLRKDSVTQAGAPSEEEQNRLRHVEGAEKEAAKKEPAEQPSPMLDRFGDKLSRYLKMARRDSVTRDKDKKDRFKTVNYDKTLRNIKSKRINPDTLEDMSDEVKPLELDEPPKSLLTDPPKRTRGPSSPTQPVAAAAPPQPPPRHPEGKKKKRRGIQVGEPLPQYILDSLRGALHGFKPTRKLSKAESEISASADEKCSDPLSPRYSITVSDDLGTRDLTLSDIESSTVAPFSLYSSARTSLDVTGDTVDEYFASRGAAGADGHPGGAGVGPGAPPPPPPPPLPPKPGVVAMPPSQPVAISEPRRASSSGPSAASSSPSKHGFFARRLSHARSPSTQLQHALAQQAAAAGHGSKRGFLSTVMQKTGKASNHGSRVVAKKLWKSRSKSQSRTSLSSACVWTPQGSCQWVNIQGRAVALCDTTLLQLTDMEAAAVQQLALQRLADFNLGCTVRIPKDFNVTAGHKPKRRPYLLKKRPLTTGFFDTAKRDEKGNNNNAQGMVFGIPLKTCMENDRRLRGRGGSPLRDRLDEPLSRKSSHGGSHASFSSLMDAIRDKTSGSCESLNIMEKRSSVQDSSLSLASDSGTCAEAASLQPHVPQVPQLVTACIRHIETHGLHTVGIFRVSSSKKRARQLREEFDSGADVKLSDDLCPHDVATLIKEYFRDLPEPLLPHDLYQPFLASQKIRNRKQQFDCLQHLIQLLAVPNRDTLWALLCFLKKVADCSADRRTAAGEWLTGNRMDSNNLATLFAPNILHSLAKLGSELSQQTAERIDVINVIRSLIDHNKELFEVSAELLHEAYLLLMDKQPEVLDVLLRRRLALPGDEIDLELDTSSSVLEGSECSSQPAAAADRDRTRDGGEEQRRRKREPAAQDPVSKPAVERSRRFRRRQEVDAGRERSRRRDKSGSREDLAGGGGGGGGGGGWFRRRVRSSSSTRQASEELRSSEERPAGPRWFRRRDKSSSQASDSGSEPRGRRGSLQAADRPLLMRTAPRQRSSSDQTVAAPAPQLAGRSERRLSSPELDVSGVITASLTIPAPASTGALSSAGAGATEDIPYIEECQTVSGLDDVFVAQHGPAPVLDSRQRRRSGSSDSNCSEQPITGSLSIQPLARSASGLTGDRGFVITAGGEPAPRPQLKVVRSPSADSAGSVGSEGGKPAAPPAAAPRRRVRSPAADHVTLGQLVLPSGGGAEMARSRTAPNISQHTVVAAPAPAPALAPVPVRRRQPATAESPTPEPRVRRRAEGEAPARRTRRPAGRSVTANVYELQKSESDSPTVWKRRQLIASDTHSGV